MTAVEPQSALLPPAQPKYILRGHVAQVHSVRFMRQNALLVTGDADGWIVYWRLDSKRPVAVWRAHDAAILGTAEWGLRRVLTHGRDNALRIWLMGPADEQNMSSVLPADGSAVHRPKPWLLHSLPVNTLNFCAFSVYHGGHALNIHRSDSVGLAQGRTPTTGLSDSILVAVPARDDRKMEVYRFPDEMLAYVVPKVDSSDTGMVMAVRLAHHQPSDNLLVIAGYEGGFTAVFLLGHNARPASQAAGPSVPELAQLIYLSQPHTQPILSLDASPDASMYFTSSADDAIAAHMIPDLRLHTDEKEEPKIVPDASTPSTILSPRSSASTRNPHESIDHTSLPKAPGQPLEGEASSTPEPALVRGEREAQDRLSRTAFPLVDEPSSTDPSKYSQASRSGAAPLEPLSFSKRPIPSSSPAKSSPIASAGPSESSGLSAMLSSAPPQPKIKPSLPTAPAVNVQPPFKITHTKHSGQQSLCVRSDGRILATGGWDKRVRVYSAKSLKELAVLKWHTEGVYAVALANILQDPSPDHASPGHAIDPSATDPTPPSEKSLLPARPKLTGVSKLQQQREYNARMTHWVAAGAKDGKVSLWEIY